MQEQHTRSDSPLRVCFLTYPPDRYSGAVFHAIWLAEKLATLGVEIEFLALTPDDRPPRGVVSGFPAHYLRRRPGWRGAYPELSFWPQLIRFFRRERFDVVHLHLCFYLEAFAAVAARLAGTASVANVMQQGSDLARMGRFETPIHRRLLRFFDRIIPISEETYAEALGIGVDGSRLVKIPIAVDTNRFRPATPELRRALRARYHLPLDAPVVSYVGAFSERKNVVWLLDAWLESEAAREGAHLLLVGDVANDPEGPEVRRQVEARIRQAADRVHWIPFVREIEEVYAASDVFVLPSLREGMPTVVLQAMASGLPVLVTPASGVPEVVGESGERGRIFGFNDREGFHAGLEALLGDEERRRAIGSRAREHVVAHYSLDGIARRYQALYEEVARPRALR